VCRTSADLLRVMFTPQRTLPSADADRILAGAAVRTGVVDGDEVVSYSWGAAEPRVLLVHGWSGNAGQWAPLAQALVAAGLGVVTADQPGHGRSAGGRSSVVHFAKQIEQAHEVHGPFQAIVAHSLGAAAAAIAMSRTVAAPRAVFVNPMSSYRSMWLRTTAALEVSAELMAEAVRAAEQWLQVRFDEIEPGVLAPGMRSALLLVQDRNDRESTLSDGAALAAAWPGAELVEVENLGHTRVLGNAEVIRRVVDFVAR